MRCILAPLLLALTLAANAQAQDPAPAPIPPAPRPTRIVLPDSILPYRLVEISVTGDFDGAIFDIEPDELADYRDNGNNAITMTGPPGRYVVKATTFKSVDGKVKPGKARAVFVIPGPIPEPTPTPDPDDGKPRPKPVPPPPPAPPLVTGHIYASYIVDASMVTPAQAAMKRPATVDAAFKTMDASWKWYQSNEAEIQAPDPSKPNEYRNNLISIATPADLPTLIIQGPDGKVLRKIKAPTEADAIAAVKALRTGGN